MLNYNIQAKYIEKKATWSPIKTEFQVFFYPGYRQIHYGNYGTFSELLMDFLPHKS